MVRITIALLILQFAHTLNAQSDRDFRTSYIGVRAGYGYSAVLFNPGAGTAGVLGPVIGASYRFESPRNKSIELGLMYHTTGWTIDQYERRIDLIALPVTGHIRIGKGRVQPVITLGETLTYALSDNSSGTDPSSPTIFDDLPIDNRLGFGLNGGLGLSVKTGRNLIQFEARATFMLTNLYDRDNEPGFSRTTPLFIDGSVKYLFQMQKKILQAEPKSEK